MDAITIAENEEYLRQKSTPIDFDKDNIEEYISILDDYFKESDIALAMAAVQLGIPKRLIYIKNTNLELIERKQQDEELEEDKSYNEKRILINPVIINREGLTSYWEACASCLDNTGLVKRPYKIDIEYFDINKEKHVKTFEGFEATVLSHEMDHLDGVLHIDIAEEVLVMTPEERKEFRKTHGYNIISTKGSFEELSK